MGRVAVSSKGVPLGGASTVVERVFRDDARLDLATARAVAHSSADPARDSSLRKPQNTSRREPTNHVALRPVEAVVVEGDR